MATEFDIAVAVLNRAEIKKLENDIDDLEQQIRELNDAYKDHKVNDEAFNAGMRVKGEKIEVARTQIEKLVRENIRLGESVETHAIPSMRTAIRVMDQLAMGSEGLIRSIPSLISQFGAAGPLVLGVGATALAIDMLAQHWQDLQDAFGDVHGIEGAKTALESLAEWSPAADEALRETLGQRGIRQRVRGEEEKRAQVGKAAVEAAIPEEERERGKLFEKALGEYRGTNLLKDMMDMFYKGQHLTEGQRAYAEDEMYKAIERGISGSMKESNYRAMFGEKFLDVWGKAFEKREKPAIEKLDKEYAEEEKRLDKEMGHAALKEWDDMIKEMEAGIRATTKHQIEQLEDQRTTLERQKRDMARDVHRTIYSSVEEHARGSQLGILNEIPKRRLKLAEELNKKIDAVNDNITKLRRGAVFQ